MKKESIAAYHLNLKIREILSLSSGLSERYVLMYSCRKSIVSNYAYVSTKCCVIFNLTTYLWLSFLLYSIKSSLELLEYKKWFRSFANEWVSTVCSLFHSGVKKSTEETHKVNYIQL